MATAERTSMKLDDWKDVVLIDEPMDDSLPVELLPAERLKTYQAEFEHCIPLCSDDGWFLEFGVYEGRTINICAQLKPDVTFYGFDSFKGLPEDWVMSRWKTLSEGYFALSSLPTVEDNVNLIPGFFDQSLPIWVEENLNESSFISWLHVDCDLYSSAKYVLSTLNNYIKPGTVIRFDELVDWRLAGFETTHPHKRPKPKYVNWKDGEWKALCEWLLEFNREVRPSWREWHQGAGLVVVK